MIGMTADGPFVYGTCAFCGIGLPPGARLAQPRQICDSPECKSAACAYGARRATITRRNRLRDLTERECPQCHEVKPLDEEHFYPRHRGKTDDPPTLRFDSWCKTCRRRKSAESYQRRKDRANAKNREARANRLANETPEEYRQRLIRQRRASAKWRAENPEKFRESQGKSRAKRNADPERRRHRNETARLAYRMRAEREGRTIKPRTRERERDERRQGTVRKVPAQPLGVALERVMLRELASLGLDGVKKDSARNDDATGTCRESVALGWGTTDRTLRRWKTGEAEFVKVTTAESVMLAAGLLAHDVWEDPDVLAIFRG